MKKRFNGWLAAEIVALIVLIGCLGIIVMRTERQLQYNDIRTEAYVKWYVAQKTSALQAATATPTPKPTPVQTPVETPKSTIKPASTSEPTSTALPTTSSATPKATA
jgi:hypothetical protein